VLNKSNDLKQGLEATWSLPLVNGCENVTIPAATVEKKKPAAAPESQNHISFPTKTGPYH